MTQASASDGESRQGLIAGILCYTLWAGMPFLFLTMGHAGATPLEIVGQRAVWSAPWAAALVLIAGQWRQAMSAFVQPRVLGWLVLSTVLLTTNWTVFVWAVNNGHNIESSLGYFIVPLISMGGGAVFFGERMNRFGIGAMLLATFGVVLQTLAMGRLPIIGLVLAASFGTYGLVRKHVAVDAQAGLLVESLLIAVPGLAYCVWLYAHGLGLFGHSVGGSVLMAVAGPATVFPLALFAWAARRLKLATMGFLQFFGPTTGFALGVALGEPLTPLRIVSFVFIWGGAGLYVYGAIRASRTAA